MAQSRLLAMERLLRVNGSRDSTLSLDQDCAVLAFEGCRMLAAISLPRSTEAVGHSCFRKCTCLVKVQFQGGSKLRRIEADAFKSCARRLATSVPVSVRESERVEFRGMSELACMVRLTDFGWSNWAGERRKSQQAL
jgi:hypothetical protein